MAMALAEAIARLDDRFGARTVIAASEATERSGQRRFKTETPFDAVCGGIEAGSALVLAGEGTCGKVTVALHAVAGAQRDGGMALWIDPLRSFDPLAAQRAGVAVTRVIVVRARDREEMLIAASAGLHSQGFRLVVVDVGPSFAQATAVDPLAPLLAQVRGSTSALMIVSDSAPHRLQAPAFVFERVGWERRYGRTAGWTFTVRRADDANEARALLREAV